MAFPSQISSNMDIIAGGADLNEHGACPPGAFFDGATDRFFIAYDTATRNIRAYKSSTPLTNWATWNELDALNAPAVPADGSGSFPSIWEYNNVCQDLIGRKLYVVYWNLSHLVTVIPFDLASGLWGVPIVSTFTYKDTSNWPGISAQSGFACTFRVFDSAVWMAFTAGGASAADSPHVWGAKCLVTGAGWDVAMVEISGTVNDGWTWDTCTMATDSTDRIQILYTSLPLGVGFSGTVQLDGTNHLTGVTIVNGGGGYSVASNVVLTLNGTPHTVPGTINSAGVVTAIDVSAFVGTGPWTTATIQVFGASSNPNRVFRRSIETTDSLGTEELIASDTVDLLDVSKLFITSADILLFTFNTGPTSPPSRKLHVARGVPGGPWEILVPPNVDAVLSTSGAFTVQGIVHSDGLDRLFLDYQDTLGTVLTFAMSTSTAAGDPWSVPAAVGSVAQGPVNFGSTSVVAVAGSWAISFGYGSNFGMAFWELAAAPPPPLVIGDSPPDGMVGTPYSACFPASGGTPPYTFSISAGSLPPGLTLDPATGCATGTPTTAGDFCFTVTVTDALFATASVGPCILILAAPVPSDLVILLIGWKLYPESPCEDLVPGVEPPHVKRAV